MNAPAKIRLGDGTPLVTRMSAAEYHADPAPVPSLSATLGKLLLTKSPRHAWHASPRLNPDWEPKTSETFNVGRAAHRAVLGAGEDYVAIPSEILAKNGAASTSEAKAFIAAQLEAGRTPLKPDAVDEIEQMAALARVRLAEHGVQLDPERSELCAVAEIDGVWCRAMFDNVPADPRSPIWDFKTCEDASPQACLRAVINYGYDFQAEHYRAVWKAVTGENREFGFIFQEKSAPYEVCLIKLSGQFLDLAAMRAARARKIWAECTRTNNWPGYPTGFHEIDAPAWLVEREMQEHC
ncbi:PD-(D/E)XK nuclease-like domain-containing protein [Novosphingobium olei]|uniref:PD-(D/E)XK nuclease-like domain-containing protein n=1 Tax=Novosphingobium olei TaxID=2728851 RepID=UPI00308E1801|nr:PD-(D/E)XK nuclease-like domain-containing protein [Novosphingobium olei]